MSLDVALLGRLASVALPAFRAELAAAGSTIATGWPRSSPQQQRGHGTTRRRQLSTAR